MFVEQELLYPEQDGSLLSKESIEVSTPLSLPQSFLFSTRSPLYVGLSHASMRTMHYCRRIWSAYMRGEHAYAYGICLANMRGEHAYMLGFSKNEI